MDQLSKYTSGFTRSLSPYTAKIESGYTHFRQYANESIRGVTPITEPPSEYLALESRLNAFHTVYVKLHEYILEYSSINNTELSMFQSQLKSLSFKLDNTMFNFTNRHLPNDLLDPHRRKAAEEITMDYEGKKESTTLGKLSKNCITNAETLGRDGPIGSGLSKFGKLQADINDSYIKMVTEIQINVLPLLRDENADAVEAAIKSCKDVKSARLSLDSLKRSLSGAKPEKVARIQQSIETAEDDFVSKVGDSMDKMKKTLDSPNIINALSIFVKAQQEFYQKASQLVQSTEKELEEIKVTQETLAGQ